jgi:phage I-like protein
MTNRRPIALLNGLKSSDHVAFLAVDLGSPKEAPKEFRLFKSGESKTVKGSFKFTERSAKEVLARLKEYGNQLHLDWDHAAILKADKGEKSPAACWYDTEVRKDASGNPELWACNAQWTEQGKKDVESREYRYISPAFFFDPETLEVTELINAALTNTPATHSQNPLLASALAGGTSPNNGDDKMDRKLLIAILKLSENATDAEIQAALTGLTEAKGAMLSTSGRSTVSEALALLSGAKATQEQVATLSAELTKLRGDQAKTEVEQLITQGEKDGKIPPGSELRAYLAKQPKDAVVAFLAVAPKVAPGTKTEKKADEKKDGEGTASEYVLSEKQEKALAYMSRVMEVKPDEARKLWVANAAAQTRKQAERDARSDT